MKEKSDQRRMDSIYCHFGNLCNCAHYDRTDKRKEVKKMKAKFKDGHFNACYGGSTIYEKSTLQGMTKAHIRSGSARSAVTLTSKEPRWQNDLRLRGRKNED